MSTSRPSQTYTCNSRGCDSGRSFEAAPEDWFHSKGLTPPRHCPHCRDWCRAQVDESIECGSCAWLIPISARRKVSFHKREGAWLPPTHCSRCLLDPQDTKEREAAKKLADPKRDRKPEEGTSRLQRVLAERGLVPGTSGSYNVGNTDEWWMGVQPSYRKEYDPAYNHVIVEHGKEIAEAVGLSEIAQVVPYLSDLSRSTDPTRFVEFSQQKLPNTRRDVVKLDLETGVAIMLERATNTPITAFCPSVMNITGKLDGTSSTGFRWSAP